MSFANIKGHDNVVYFFKRELEQGRIASSYLFFGPDGVGKAFLAFTLAKALNCLNLKNDACDECASCVKINSKAHPDVITVDNIDEKESIGISSIRELQERVSLKPYEGRKKIFVISNSHTMTPEAQNCLLKTLEEPPNDSVLILISSMPEELLPTVKSRCRQIKFNALTTDKRIELAMNKGFLRDEAVFLSRLANSGIIISFDREEEKIDLLKYKNRVIGEFCGDDTLLSDKSPVFGGSRERSRLAVSIIASWYRDIMVLKAAMDPSLIINFDRIDDLRALKNKVSFEELERIAKEIETAQYYIERNVGPKIAINDLKIKVSLKKGD